MKQLELVLLLVLLVGCARGTPAPSPTPTPIPTAVPTAVPTPTLVPLSEIDIETILVAEGDLPATISAGQIRDYPPIEVELSGKTQTSRLYRFVDEMPPCDGAIYRELHSSEIDFEGGVTVFLYESEDNAKATYQEMATYMQTNEPYTYSDDEPAFSVSDVGDEAVSVDMGFNLDFVHFSAFAFRRCHAVVHILIRGGDTAVSTAYAKRLDERLKPLVCR